MEGKNRIDELKAQSERLKAEEDMLNAKVAQLEKEMLEAEKEKMKAEAERLEKELMEKEIAELKKQLEVLEEKDVVESQPSKMEAAEPVVSKESQTAAPEGLDTNVPTVDDAAGIQENISSVIMQAIFNILFCLHLVFGAVCLVLFFIFDIDLLGYLAITTGILSIYAIILRNNRKKRIDAIATRLENKNVEIGVETTVTEPQNAEEALQERKIAEPEKQAELLEEKVVEPFKVETVMEPQPSKLETAEPVATEKPQTVEAEPVMKEVSGDETDKEEGTPLQTDAVPEKSEKKNGKKKLWLILLLAFILTAAACCVVFLKLFAADDKAGNKVSVEEPVEVRVEEPVYDEAALDSLRIVGIMEEVNHLNNDHRYPYELPLSSEYSQLLTRANDITDSITRTTGAEWDDEWYDLAIPWMEPWADPDTVEYKILEYVSLGYGDDRRVEVTVEYNDPQYRGYLSTVTTVFVSEAGRWVIDNVGSHKEVLADFIERNTSAQNKNLVFRVNDVEFEMVAVGGSSFIMGATSEQENAYNDEKPTHNVVLNDYYIGETEVTQELWQAVMGTNPSHFNGSRLPVESVSYNDCVEFINELNKQLSEELDGDYCFRLPTEAEWEFAARGGNLSLKSTQYSGGQNVDDVAWYDANSGGSPRLVMSKSPNELGIYDMSGNVYEWCSDLYDKDFYASSPQYNPENNSTGTHRVLRGGAWDLPKHHCRVSLRNYAKSAARGYSNGLRLVLAQKVKEVTANMQHITDVITIVEEPDEAPIPVLDENGYVYDDVEESDVVFVEEDFDEEHIFDVAEEQP